MRKTTLAIGIALAALVLAGAGCGKTPTASVPQAPVPQAAAPEKPPGLPRETQQHFDTEDNLNAALDDLNAVE